MSLPRGSAERAIRGAVVERLRSIRPNARICHEVNSGSYGPTRIDVIAVDVAEIIAVEIKSEKDKLDRAPKQIEAMRGCSSHVVVAFHECHLVEHPTNEHCAQFCGRDKTLFMHKVPEALKGATPWIYPELIRPGILDTGPWRAPDRPTETALPSSALHLLWRDELAELCDRLRISRSKRANMKEMVTSVQWLANGKELTLGICAALRARPFAAADDPLTWEAAE